MRARKYKWDLSASSPCEWDVLMEVDVVSAKCILCVGRIGDVCVWYSRVHPPVHHVLAAINTFKQIVRANFYFLPHNNGNTFLNVPYLTLISGCIVEITTKFHAISMPCGARWLSNRESPSSNPLRCCFEALAFLFSPRRLSSLSCINEYLAIDGGGNVSDLVVARNCSVARMLPREVELVAEWTGLSAVNL